MSYANKKTFEKHQKKRNSQTAKTPDCTFAICDICKCLMLYALQNHGFCFLLLGIKKTRTLYFKRPGCKRCREAVSCYSVIYAPSFFNIPHPESARYNTCQ